MKKIDNCENSTVLVALVRAALGLLLASRSFRRLKELHL